MPTATKLVTAQSRGTSRKILQVIDKNTKIKISEANKMQENYMVCNCKQVSYNDIADALHQQSRFENVLSAFEDVQKVTHCSTGCGGLPSVRI